MADVCVIKDMRELRDFLTGRYVQTGHPYEDQEKKLEQALNKCVIGVRAPTAEALRVIMTALAERDENGAEGWLMAVLHDHASDPDFKHIEEVCVEIRNTFKWRTGNSSVPWFFSGVPDETVRDGWQEVDGDSEIYHEVACYVELRRQLPFYEFFVRKDLRERLVELGHAMPTHQSLKDSGQLPPAFLEEWDALDNLDIAIRRLPAGSQVLRGSFLGDPKQFAWQLERSYEKFSKTNQLSRSWLLANVPAAAGALEAVAKRADALLPTKRGQHSKRVEEWRHAFQRWRSLAESQLHVPFAVHEAVQRGGCVKKQKTTQNARLAELLAALLNVYH